MSTKQQTIDRFKYHYPDAEDTLAEDLFDEAHREILEKIQARNSEVTISLTAGTREYALSDTVVKIWEAYYEESSSTASWYKLLPTSKAQLSDLGSWRTNAQQVRPSRYYVSTTTSGNTSTRVVGFDTLMPTTTSGTYPRVKLYCTSVATLGLSDDLPVEVYRMTPYVYLMCWRFSLMHQPEKQEYWKHLFEQELDAVETMSKGILAENEGMFLRPRIRLSRSI